MVPPLPPPQPEGSVMSGGGSSAPVEGGSAKRQREAVAIPEDPGLKAPVISQIPEDPGLKVPVTPTFPERPATTQAVPSLPSGLAGSTTTASVPSAPVTGPFRGTATATRLETSASYPFGLSGPVKSFQTPPSLGGTGSGVPESPVAKARAEPPPSVETSDVTMGAVKDALHELWEKIEDVVNDDSVSNTVNAVTDWLDTWLDQEEVRVARMDELRKIQSEFFGLHAFEEMHPTKRRDRQKAQVGGQESQGSVQV